MNGKPSRPAEEAKFFHSQLSYKIIKSQKNLVTFEFSKINTVAKKNSDKIESN